MMDKRPMIPTSPDAAAAWRRKNDPKSAEYLRARLAFLEIADQLEFRPYHSKSNRRYASAAFKVEKSG